MESTSSLVLLLQLMKHFGAYSSNITCLFKGLKQLQNVMNENPKVSSKDLCLIQGSKQQFGDEGPWISETPTYQLQPPVKIQKNKMDHKYKVA